MKHIPHHWGMTDWSSKKENDQKTQPIHWSGQVINQCSHHRQGGHNERSCPNDLPHFGEKT